MKKKRWSRLGALFLMANVTLTACQQQDLELSTIGLDAEQLEGVESSARTNFSLTAEAKPSENYIRLDWTDLSNTTYKVYQRPEGSSEFNPISMTNFENQDPVKVLNIYPSQGIPYKDVHQEDLAYSPEKQSALLNDWIKDYGLGKITVDTVNVDAFGSNPDRYLKDSNGNYKYDVLAIGFWNINYESMFLNDQGVQAVADFIEYGGGVLAGHHHLGVFQLDRGLNRIKDLFGVKFVIENGTLGLHNAPLRDTELANVDYVAPDISEAVHTSRYWYASEKVKIEKKGLLTQYPWNIETENLMLDIPYSHNGHEFVTGDVWLSFVPGTAHNSPNGTPVKELTQLPDGTTGTKGAYLSTYKNTALIQTGHNSIVNHDTALEATEDEKKILVNTLFYLNQLSDDNYLNDHSGRDLADPVISKVDHTVNGSTFKFTVTAMDQGSTYEYYVEAQPKDGSAKLTSNTVTETITTGIKGYSYVIDTNPTTEPDHTVDSTSNVVTGQLPSGDAYLHIKAVDEAGNVSETVHIKLEKASTPLPTNIELTAQANPDENYIRLDWTEVPESTYRVYQRPEGADEFQSISMTDLSKGEPIKVLNIYPTYVIPEKEDGSLDIAGKRKTKSAILEDWIADYGLGLIQVDSLNKEDFENNPNKWLKHSDGSYKYDVIVVGFWNIELSTHHIYSDGIAAISEFIDNGGGVLAGHQHIGYHGFNQGLNTIKQKFGVKLIKEQGAIESDLGNIDYVLPEVSVHDESSYYWTMGSKVVAAKSGLLLNYPYEISQKGRIFNIPLSHDTWEFYTGDVWLQYHEPVSHVLTVIPHPPAKDISELPDGTKGTSNGYLHTYNNTAIIQTGHTSYNGELAATEDEKKILVNTLLYLNQLSDINYLDDHSGQDIDNPVISKVNQTINGSSFELTLTAMDQGSTYEYYVEAQPKDGSSKLTSNTVTETITTGVKGYSYVLDTNPTTEPDETIDSTSNAISGQLTDDVMYLHIKAIDGAGNVSETMHIKLERPDETLPKPVITTAEQRDDQIYVNWDIEIPESSIIWNDDFSSKQLDLPNNIASGITIPHNGKIYDLYGNRRPDDDIIRRSVKIIDGVGINGSRGVVVTQTLPNNGWNYFYYGNEDLPLSGVDVSGYRDSDWQQLKTNRPAIVRFVTKGSGEFGLLISPEWTGNGVSNEYNLTWAENLTAQEFETALINQTPIKVNNPLNEPIFNFHLTTAFDHTNSYNFKLSVGHITKNNSDGNWYYTSYAWYGPWCDAVKPGQYVTPENQRNVESITVGKSLSQLQGSPSGHNQIAFNTPDWTNYSMNIYIPNSPEIEAIGNYFRMTTVFKSASQFYLDNLVVAYAPKSRLYRDGKLIHEDYTVEYEDADVQDTEAPNPAVVSTSYDSNGRLVLTWQEGQDRGTIYTYEVSAVSQTGKESEKSDPKQVEFISGIQEYRIYVDGQLIGTTTDLTYELSKDLIGNGHLQLGIVDQEGNESLTDIVIDVTAPDLTLEATPTEWTKGPVTIQATATDSGSGVSQIVLPNNNIVFSDQASYEVFENGNYTFVAVDQVGNLTTEVIEITNIDKTPPTIEVTKAENDWSSNQQIHIEVTDDQSGVHEVQYQLSGALNQAWTTISPSADLSFENQTGTIILTIKATDQVGNESMVKYEILSDNGKPSIIRFRALPKK